MRLDINDQTGLIKEYFLQMLCLIYFHGEKFPREAKDPKNIVSFKLWVRDGIYNADVEVNANGKIAFGKSHLKLEEILSDKSEIFAISTSAGRAFLDACEKLFGFLPPWGLLTGVRPAKQALKYLKQGVCKEEIIKIFKSDFLITEEKARLCIKAAEFQNNIAKTIDENKDCALYIAIPFCPTRCGYCSFVSYSGKKLFDLIPSYIERLVIDLKETATIIKESGMRLKSIYIGGGTPTILNEQQLDFVLGCVNNNFDLRDIQEYTLEAGRPDTINLSKLKIARRYNINRISINPQTLDENILKAVGRNHSVKQFYDAFEMAKSQGFEINTDLIAALPNDTVEGFEKTVRKVISCEPANITIHSLALKNAALLREQSFVTSPDDNIAISALDSAYRLLEQANYEPYYLYRQKNTSGNGENCGFALSGTECLYNVFMMEGLCTVFGCGASAVTKIVKDGEVTRLVHPKYPFEYLSEKGYEKGVFGDRIKEILY